MVYGNELWDNKEETSEGIHHGGIGYECSSRCITVTIVYKPDYSAIQIEITRTKFAFLKLDGLHVSGRLGHE